MFSVREKFNKQCAARTPNRNKHTKRNVPLEYCKNTYTGGYSRGREGKSRDRQFDNKMAIKIVATAQQQRSTCNIFCTLRGTLYSILRFRIVVYRSHFTWQAERVKCAATGRGRANIQIAEMEVEPQLGKSRAVGQPRFVPVPTKPLLMRGLNLQRSHWPTADPA